MKFYNKKYTDAHKGIQYTPYSSYYDDETCEDYDKDVKIDEIDKVEEFFKINIHSFILKMKTITLKQIEEIAVCMIKIFIYLDIIIIFV